MDYRELHQIYASKILTRAHDVIIGKAGFEDLSMKKAAKIIQSLKSSGHVTALGVYMSLVMDAHELDIDSIANHFRKTYGWDKIVFELANALIND